MKLKELLNEIDARRSDLVQLTCDLVKIPTVNPPGNNYREICEFLSIEFLEERMLEGPKYNFVYQKLTC